MKVEFLLRPTSPAPSSWVALCVLLALTAGGVPEGHAANSIYPEPLELVAFGGPTTVVSLDVNEDGLFDLAVNGPELQRITIFFGTGTGGFASELRIDTTPREAADMTTFDVDRDGLADIVWVDGLRGDVVTFYQVPGGAGDVFRRAVVPGVETATSLAAVDRDGDGWIDVVAAERGSDEIVWYRNDAGTLVLDERLRAGDGPREIRVLRDPVAPPRLALLQDGFLSRDVTVYALDDEVPGARWPVDVPRGLVVGDLQDDGADELVVTDATGSVVVLEPDAGGLTPRAEFPIRPESPWALPVSISTTGERILVAETERGRLNLFQDSGSGFTSRANWFVSRTVARPLLADVDRDGFRELSLPLPEDDVVLVVDPLVDGYLIPDAIETGERPRRVAGTPEGDPTPRVATLAGVSDEIWIHRVVDGRLDLLQTIGVSPVADEILLRDLDGQNGADLVLLDAFTGVQLAYAQADGSFGPLNTIYATSDANDVAVGEFLATPGLELAVADDGIDAVRILEQTTPGQWTVATEAAIGQEPLIVRARDLDGNGFDDVVVLSTVDRMTLVFTEATGVLSVAGFPTALSPRDVAFGNFNDDEFPDIVVASAGTSTFTLWSSLFRGFYAVSDGNNEAPFGAQSIATADFNGDGVDDIVLGSPAEPSFSVHTVIAPTGDVLESTQVVRVCEQPIDFLLMRIDGDDVDDIVAIDRESDVLVTVRSDPFAQVPPVTGSLTSTLVDGRAELEVTADARVVDEFAVFRLADGRPVPMRYAGAGAWVGVDPEPVAPDAIYVLRDRQGAELDRATTSDGNATAIDGPGPGAEILPPVVRGRQVVLRFRTGGNRAPAVRVHDVRGRLVGETGAVATGDGWFESRWDGRDPRGRRLARGRYFVHIEGPAGTLSTPITLR